MGEPVSVRHSGSLVILFTAPRDRERLTSQYVTSLRAHPAIPPQSVSAEPGSHFSNVTLEFFIFLFFPAGHIKNSLFTGKCIIMFSSLSFKDFFCFVLIQAFHDN